MQLPSNYAYVPFLISSLFSLAMATGAQAQIHGTSFPGIGSSEGGASMRRVSVSSFGEATRVRFYEGGSAHEKLLNSLQTMDAKEGLSLNGKARRQKARASLSKASKEEESAQTLAKRALQHRLMLKTLRESTPKAGKTKGAESLEAGDYPEVAAQHAWWQKSQGQKAPWPAALDPLKTPPLRATPVRAEIGRPIAKR